MSNFETEILEMIKGVFPKYKVIEQHSVFYMGTQLFFDFYIPALNILIECQGEQHYKYVPHFHGLQNEFKGSQKRDQLKREWAEQEHIVFLEIKFDDRPKDSKELFARIHGAVFKGEGAVFDG